MHAIGFIGSGQMATALAKGWLAAGLLDASKSVAADPIDAARRNFQTATGLAVVETNAQAVRDIVVLAVKPQMMPSVLAELKPVVQSALVVSIAAGITLASLQAALGDCPIVRVMPNTPCLVGASASAFSVNERVTANQRAKVEILLGAVGVAYAVPEKQLDAVTGLSGSGPAYVYTFIEALADGGVKMGLPRETALKLAAQTVLGSAKMVLDTGTHPAVLRDAVTSPGGTTIAGLAALEAAAFRSACIQAVEAATRRAMELGKS